MMLRRYHPNGNEESPQTGKDGPTTAPDTAEQDAPQAKPAGRFRTAKKG